MEYVDSYRRQAILPPRSKIKVARSRDASDRCWSIRRQWNVLETPKLVEQLLTLRAITRTGFMVDRSQRKPIIIYIVLFLGGHIIRRTLSKVTRSTNAETGRASYLANGKAYELQTWYTVGAWRDASRAAPLPQKSMVMVTRLRGPSDRRWPISREWKASETDKNGR